MWLDPREGDKTLQVLVIGADAAFEEEFRSALARIPDRKGSIVYADTYREAIDAARRRQPHLIVIDIDREPAQIAVLSKDLQAILPEAAIAGAFMPDRLEQGHSEGTTLIELLRAHVRDFLRRPLSATELRGVIDRLFARQTAAAAAAQGRVAAFLSNKGGVGKSTLATNVAIGLALRHPDEVLLVDTSLQIGTCAMLLDLKPTTSIIDAVRERDRLDKTLLRHLTIRHGSGLRLLAAPTDALEGSEVDDEAVARIVNMARRSFEYVIVDTFPMLDGVLMTILDISDLNFIVVQGTAPSVAGIARLLPVLERVGVPQSRQRLVLNYNYKPFLGNLQPSDIANRLQRTIDYVVPYEGRVLSSMNTGTPHLLHARRWERFGRSVNQIVNDLNMWAVDTAGESAVPQRPVVERRLKIAETEEAS